MISFEFRGIQLISKSCYIMVTLMQMSFKVKSLDLYVAGYFYRPYLANLLPCIVKISKREEDTVQVSVHFPLEAHFIVCLLF